MQILLYKSRAYVFSYLHTYIHTYIHTYTRAYFHTPARTCAQLKKRHVLTTQYTYALNRFQRISMEVSASSPNKNEELTLALKTWSKLEEETTGRPKLKEGMRVGAGPGGAGTVIGGGGREIGEGVGIAERDRVREGSAGGVRRIVGSTAVEVESDSDYNDGK